QLGDSERTAAARAADLELQKQETTTGMEAMQKRLADAEQKTREAAAAREVMQKRLTEAEQKTKETTSRAEDLRQRLAAEEQKGREVAARADDLQKQLLDLQVKVPKELAKEDTPKSIPDPKFADFAGTWKATTLFIKGKGLLIENMELTLQPD